MIIKAPFSLLFFLLWTSTTRGSSLANVALNKPAKQSSNYHSVLGHAEKAVDGNPSGAWASGSMSHTAITDSNPEWEVDLQGEFRVTSVVVHNRVDCCSERLSGAVVTLLDDSFQDLFSGSLGDMTNVPSRSINVPSGVPAKVSHVRVSKDTVALHMAEVEVFVAQFHFAGHQYEIVQVTKSWHDARDDALTLSNCGVNGHLVTISSQTENDFVKSLITQDTWIGFTDEATEGTWVWVTGESTSYTSWSNLWGGQPDNFGNAEHCAEMFVTDDGGWGDRYCTDNRHFVVEYDCPLFDFDVVLDRVDINFTTDTNFTEAIIFRYSYTGATPSENTKVSFTYDIREDDCRANFAPYGDASKALYFNDFDDTALENQVIARLGINPFTIEDATEVWMQENGETQATLSFCGVWNIYVDNRFVQFHETNVTAIINLKEGSGFTVETLSVGLDRQDANALDEDVEVQFPLDVFICDDDTTKTNPAPTGFTQGEEIQVCLKLETPTANVFVQSIDKMIYSATEVNTTMTLIDSGALMYAATAEFDCSKVAGVCRVTFIAAAAMFVNTANNNLFIEGSAVIAFGMDTRHRRMQEEDAVSKLIPFEFIVGKLQSSGHGLGSAGTKHGMLIAMVVGSVTVSLFALL